MLKFFVVVSIRCLTCPLYEERHHHVSLTPLKNFNLTSPVVLRTQVKPLGQLDSQVLSCSRSLHRVSLIKTPWRPPHISDHVEHFLLHYKDLSIMFNVNQNISFFFIPIRKMLKILDLEYQFFFFRSMFMCDVDLQIYQLDV